MKAILLTLLFALFVQFGISQIQKDHKLTVMVNGKEFTTQSQHLKFGGYRYITGNALKPDQSLRVWIAGWDGGMITESGAYLIVDGDKPDTKENIKTAQELGKYKGIAAIKYVEETKSPRMEYHVGMSENNGEAIEVKIDQDGYYDLSFNATLVGTWWKEKTTATVFGGLDRLADKMKDKAVTGATGLDQDIDPEGRGYKKQKTADRIVLKDGLIKLKMKAE